MKVKVFYSDSLAVDAGAMEMFDMERKFERLWQRVSFAEIDSAPGTWAVVIEGASEWNHLPSNAADTVPDWSQIAWMAPIGGMSSRDEYERSLIGFVDRIEVDGEVWWDAAKAFAAHGEPAR